MTFRPSGTVTFLFTDVEGSTASWERRADATRAALALHDDVVRSTIVAHGGHVFSTGGDGSAAVFERAEPALRAAIAIQVALAAVTWPEDLTLAARIGLNSGEAREHGGDYFGSAVSRGVHVMDAANGTQILASASTRELVTGDREGLWRWIDLGLHELRDELEPVRLHRIRSPRFESDPRPPRSGSIRAGNLPALVTPLVGRADDVEGIVAELSSARIVTLTGVGGIGKTRLAIEAGRRLQPMFGDGVWLAALDTIDRPDALLPTLCGLFGIEHRSADDVAGLVDGLRFRDALLVLDNCEHLLDAVADVAGILASSCPTMRILATSREPLDLDGERVRRVRSLPVDHDGTAAALFRLRAEEAGATLDPGRDADAIAQICARLDGIPLAIELAAARTRSLRPAEIAARLDDMFRLLTGGKRASAARHRTLRATLEWSHDMLGDAEQAVLARLSVFAGSFVLDAAEAVAGDGEVVDVLDRLVARSLVVPVDTADETRLRLLEPVRQLAAEKLAGRGEADRTRARHTEWYLTLMKRLGAQWRSGHDQEAWPVAARELPNLRAAFDDLIETVRIDDAEAFVVGSYGPIACQFDVAPMYEWAPKVLGLASDHVGPDTASVCAVAAWGAIPRGDFDTATMYLRRGVDAITAGSRDDGLVIAAAIHSVLSGGQPAVDDEFLEASVTSALESDDLHRQVWVLTYAGRAEDGAERAEQLGNRMLLAMARGWNFALSGDRREEAAELFWDAARESHSYLMRNGADLELGKKQLRVGSPLDALLVLRSPLRDWLLRGDARVWVVLHVIARALLALGDGESAARFAGAIGDRPLPFTSPRARAALASQLDGSLEPDVRARHQAAGRGLDAGTAAMEALARIEVLADAASRRAVATSVDADDLTPRQQEVAALVARGLANKQIAQRLAISRYTVETHVRNILERLGAASRSEIATWYAQQQATGSGTSGRT